MDFHKHIIRDMHDSSRKLGKTFAFSAGREKQMGREKTLLLRWGSPLHYYRSRSIWAQRGRWDCIRKHWRCCVCPLVCLWSVPCRGTQIRLHKGVSGVLSDRGGWVGKGNGVSHFQCNPFIACSWNFFAWENAQSYSTLFCEFTGRDRQLSDNKCF